MKYKELERVRKALERVTIANIFAEMCQGLGLELVLFTEICCWKSY